MSQEQQTITVNGELVLTTSNVTAELGIATSTWSAYVARGQAPPADGRIDGRTPYWLPSTIETWNQGRPRAK